jgi:filamentous hemagglutinin
MSPQGVAGTATVTKIRGRHAVVPVYNLTVQGTSRYLVGACGVVVHNCGNGSEGAGGAIQDFVEFPPNRAQIGYIFRDSVGHLADTAENRKLLIEVASNSANRIGIDRFGNTWSTMILPDGSQAWVSVRNGVIQNGGVNLVPKDLTPMFGRNP